MRYIRYLEKASREDKLAILREKWEILSKKYGNLVETSDRNRDLIWKLILNADPTKNKQYLQWIITKGILKWSNKSFSLFKEDLPTLTASLLTYDKLKRMNKLRYEHKDINRIKNDDELFDVVNQYQEAAGRTKEQDEAFFKNKAAKKLYESSTVEVVIPYTKEASCYFGTNTKWCTARADENNAFDVYNREGALYIVLDKKTGKKYQFWFDTSEDEAHQFMDYKDNEINWVDLEKQYPQFMEELRKIFHTLAKSSHYIPLMKTYNINDLNMFVHSNGLTETIDLAHRPFTLDQIKWAIQYGGRAIGDDFQDDIIITRVLQKLFGTKDLKSIGNKYKVLIHKDWPEIAYLVSDSVTVNKKRK